MIRPTRAWRTAVVLATASLALTACGGSSDNNSAGGSSSASPSESSSAATKGDGTLVVGTLLPQTGDLAFLGPPEFAGVDAAVEDINAAGGVNGKHVTQAKADSGDGTPDIARPERGQAPERECRRHRRCRVVLGLAERHRQDHRCRRGRVLAGEHLAGASTPTTTKGLYFRTAPSDVLQGAVLGNLVIQDGYNNVAILARQDSYGEGLADQVEKTIKEKGGNVATKQLYSADATNYTAEVNKVAAAKPDALVLIAFDETKKIIPPLIAKGVGPQDHADLLRRRQHRRLLKDFDPGTLKGVKATFPARRARPRPSRRAAQDRTRS